MVQYVYGGPKGREHALVVDESLVVVRTRGTSASAKSMLAEGETRQLARTLQPVMRLPHAGVTVYRSGDPDVPAASAAARKALQSRRGVRFAGRCLVDPVGKVPVLYTENIFVKFKSELDEDACLNELERRGWKKARKLEFASRAYFVKCEEGIGQEVFGRAHELLQSGLVEFCHPELIREVRRRNFPQQWHLQATTFVDPVTNTQVSVNQHSNVAAAWALTKGEGIVIAVIDDGVDVEHPEFSRPSKLHAPYDATRGIPDPRPGSGDDHGTSCAGVACADGVSRASGAAPRARLMPIRLVSGLGSMNEAEAFYWAADHGADVISCSWGPQDGFGLKTPLPDSTRLAIEYAVSNGRGGKGCVILWAAGNGNESVDDDGYASCPHVIAVGACNDKGRRSSYSDHGDSLWCCCPSDDGSENLGIFTTDRRGNAGYNPGLVDLGDVSGDYTNNFGGTSSATPLAAGIAGLVLARNPSLNWTAVRGILRQSADKIDAANGAYNAQGHSKAYGYGRLNALKAVQAALPAAPAKRVVHTVFRDVPVKSMAPAASLDLEVAETAHPKSVRISVDIEHSWRGDLLVRLKTPNLPDPIVLHSLAGDDAKNLRETYDATRVEELGGLVNKSPAGKWTLLVQDLVKEDDGLLRSFAVELTY
jgi:subtilisin family serine protease